MFLGGVLTQFLSWRAVLFVNVPLAAVAVPLALRLFPGTPGLGAAHGYDLPGGLTVTAGLLVLIYGLIQVNEAGIGAVTIVSFAGGVVLLAGFVWHENRTRTALMPLSIFRIRALAAANGISVLVSMIVGAAILLLSLQLQDVDGFGPLSAGLAFLPLAVLVGAVAVLAPRLATWFGLKPVLVTATALLAVGTLLLTRVTATSSYPAVILPGMVVLGIGFGAFISTALIAATDSVADEQQGLAAGLLNSAQQIGGSLGIALLVTLASEHTRSLAGSGKATQASGYAFGFAAAAAVGLIAVILAALTLPGEKCRPRPALGTSGSPLICKSGPQP